MTDQSESPLNVNAHLTVPLLTVCRLAPAPKTGLPQRTGAQFTCTTVVNHKVDRPLFRHGRIPADDEVLLRWLQFARQIRDRLSPFRSTSYSGA